MDDHKPELINIFEQLNRIYTTRSNTFRAKSYRKLVDSLKRYDKPIVSTANAKHVPGITAKSVAKIAEIIATGTLKQLEKLKRDDPDLDAKIELQTVLGIGAKCARKLVEKHGIRSVEELQRRQSQVQLTRMQKIGLKYYASLQERIPRKEIKEYLDKVAKSVKKIDKNALVIGAGSYLRGRPTSGDIDIILAFPQIKDYREWREKNVIGDVISRLQKDGLLTADEVIIEGHNSMMGITEPMHRQVDIRIAGYETIPFYLLYFASGEDFARKIRAFAKKKGWKLTEWNIQDRHGKILMNRAKNEREIFEMLDYPYVKPENR